VPYVAGFAGLLLFSEVLWRAGLHCMNRLDGHAIENLYVIGMDELLAKDSAFYHDNFAGSLTKRALSFATRFEEFSDTLMFNVVGNLVPIAFACVILWRYSPWLVAALLGLLAVTAVGVVPLIRRRQRLVDQREEATARVAGHVADSLANMDTVRAFAAERREAAEHAARVAEQRRKSILSWDYSNLRIDTVVAPMSVAAQALGLLLAIALGTGAHGIEAIFVSFTYFSNAMSIMFQFNQIYRNLESSLTEAAQFTELLLTPAAVTDPDEPEPLRPGPFDVRFEGVGFAHAGGRPLFTALDLDVPGGTRIGLVAGRAAAKPR
jgi:ATP-binding cassette subfamily B protein